MAPDLSLSKMMFYLYFLSTIASVFQAMGISAGGAFPLVPVVIFQSMFVACFFIAFVLNTILRLPRDSRDMLFWLKCFLMYSIFSGFILPYLFEGWLVFSPRIGIDDQVDNQTPLVFSVSNVGQVLYLLINAFFLVGGIYIRRMLEKGVALKIFLCTGIIVVFFAFYQDVSQEYGVWFPNDIIHSNDLYKADEGTFISQSIGDVQRVSSTFTEPSYAGIVLGTFFTYYLFLLYYSRFRVLNWFLLVVYLVGTLLTTSSIGYAQIIFAFSMAFIISLKNPKRISYTLVITSLIAAGGSLINSDVFLDATINKSDSLSFIHRFASDEYALKLLFDTYGLGVGLGGNRPSSFLTYMLSNVGLIGSGLFLMFLRAIVKPILCNYSILAPEQKALFFALLSHLFGKILGGPDLNFWFFWVLLTVSAITFRSIFVKKATTLLPGKEILSIGTGAGHGS